MAGGVHRSSVSKKDTAKSTPTTATTTSNGAPFKKDKVKLGHVKHFLDKIIWGHEDQSIKDPYYVKFLDKTQFTLGVLGVMLTQYFVVARPSHFWLWYFVCTPIVIALRIIYFKRVGWQYFLLDFCYFVIACSMTHVTFFYDSTHLFRVLFIYANGPLVWAVVLWRNSLVFHDVDRMSGVFIHLMPCLLYYSIQWFGCASPLSIFSGSSGQPASGPVDSLELADFGYATIGYLIWQTLYFAKTEVVDREKLDARPDLLTSLRWLTTDKKNGFSLFVLAICRQIGVMGRTEEYDPKTTKTKIIFVTGQFVYTFCTFLPTILIFRSHFLHCLYIQFIFAAAVHNGASYYFEVFAKIYQKKLVPDAATTSGKGDYELQ
ncbi:unnamed protein product [Aphanomyces euteiches]|uniref:Glycerophosphocholine acyltransferase 1 n=1 Tax=Aphanomyces euteiches TaxID=100861 RepID=A0A6G0WYG3_9STRA|nr:hypothetical protein Ae201684_010300 [Aphanomyces euteiches]KAH9090324.1 hypothetical protein Ae201684P_014130 [Aphanomyces euteiches]KAH9145170.1 hypothetical protein AeRB84_010899 [Aphanomyces euteiches]